MAKEGHVVVGSGMKPQINDCPNQTTGKKHLTGTQVVVINPEDGSAGGPFRESQVDVGTTATLVPPQGLEYRRSIAIRNNGSSNIYIGASGVTTGTGFPIKPCEIFHADVAGNTPIYAIADATVDVRIIELAQCL